jgi:hypothetical protein
MLTGKAIIAGFSGFAAVALVVGATWGVQNYVATPEDIEVSRVQLAASVQAEKAARVGSDYSLQYKYDKLDIDRQIQNTKRALGEIQERARANVSWSSDAHNQQTLGDQLRDLLEQRRDLEHWYRSIPK